MMSISVAESCLEQNTQELTEVTAEEFYRNIFPVGSFETKGEQVDGKYNGILLRFPVNNKTKPQRVTITDDLDAFKPSAETEGMFSLMSPMSYCGKSRKFENARFMYALAIDLDGLFKVSHVENLFWQIRNQEQLRNFYWGLPVPTYLVSSGTGIHIYYVFEKPIPMFKNVIAELEKLKRRLTWQAWTQGSSALHDKVQYEPLNQGFRCVGTVTKNKRVVRAFKWGKGLKTTIAKLNESVPAEEKYRALVEEDKFGYKSVMTLEQAKEKYPKWFEKRIVNGEPRGTWTTKRDLYDWWKRRIPQEAEEGHRYWCLHMLAIYAIKAGIDFEELKKDAYELQPILDKKSSPDNPFTKEDVYASLKGFKEEYKTYPINSIVFRTGLKIEKNKRNGRKQQNHIQIVNQTRKFRRDVLGEDEYKNNGRPVGSGTKMHLILDYKREHPNLSNRQIAEDLGVNRNTVNKWLKYR